MGVERKGDGTFDKFLEIFILLDLSYPVRRPECLGSITPSPLD